MITDPLIFKVLDISTNHMSREDVDNLDQEVAGGMAPVYVLKEYGWLIYVGEINDNWPGEQWSEAFLNVLKLAADLGCDYVRWDRDGLIYDELPFFDW